ncbi:MAG: tyrosine-type recombinase/integrase [Solirubrobacteraceae bacterium]
MTALAERLDRYLLLRRALGYQYQNQGRLLGEFVAFMAASKLTTVTVEAALEWASGAPTDRMSATRLTAVRGFAGYLVAFDERTQVPPSGLIHDIHVRPTPHIYSPSEITALMAAASNLTPRLWAATMDTVIGLMAATGVRPGEIYRLGRADVDLGDGQLAVMHSKYGKSRQIPLHPTTVQMLHRYAQLRDRSFPDPLPTRFFVNADGAGLDSMAVTATFNRLLHVAAIAGTDSRRHPRLGSLRHTFAVSTLLEWHHAGLDVQRQLPVLSAYLGHNEIAHTYWYLQATPELMALAADRLESSWRDRP